MFLQLDGSLGRFGRFWVFVADVDDVFYEFVDVVDFGEVFDGVLHVLVHPFGER